MTACYVPTRYVVQSSQDDGSVILHSPLTGALAVVGAEQAAEAHDALVRSARHRGPLTGILKDLEEGGFLILEGTDEQAVMQRQYLSKYTDAYLNLILMPTEECNFRCKYCYQVFGRGPMPAELQEGIRRYVAAQQRLRKLEVSWFGGEPLFAPEVVIELTRYFQEHCAARGIEYSATMTTNGSLLTPEIADEIIPRGVRHFQITIDGIRGEHDKRRVLVDGGATFETILANLRYLRRSDHLFSIMLRHNFDPEGLARLPDFIELLKAEFGGDPRFTTLFEPIGRWGGPNDADLTVCEGRETTQVLIRSKQMAIEAGFRSGIQIERFRPNGYVCYAANPRSFVVGSDGSLYKCTVELDSHDRNKVGHLLPDGTMQLDWRKMALWCETNGSDPGKKCGPCFFRPTCHGAACPKQWLDDGDMGCPHERVAIHSILPLLVKESRLPKPPTSPLVAECGRA